MSVVSAALILYFVTVMPAAAEPAFAFESIATLDDMSSFIRAKFPLGSSREELQRAFVKQGRATLRIKASVPGVEKYIYDINLCRYYIWRWNVSADYDKAGHLLQAYVNGHIVFPSGSPKKIIPRTAPAGTKAAIYRVQRPRPEADKGENSLGFLLMDLDSDSSTKDDQVLMGAGPSRADPTNMGKMVTYSDVDPWRSIFDVDPADRIAPYHGSCRDADKLFEAMKKKQSP